MTTPCTVCLNAVSGDAESHAECVQSLFGTTTYPTLEVELSTLYGLAASKMAGKMSISGAQEKVSLTLTPDNTLEVADTAGRYILKPETSQFPSLPPNEHLTMLLARLVGVDVPPLGLIRLKDGALAYVIKRFDRLDDGSKLQVEDFCQLTEKRIRDKYDGSAELCVRTLRRFATEPLIEVRKLYRLLLFCWWVENGDMHLKNFSLVTTKEGTRRLAPAYDLVCTKLVIPEDTLAMPVGGRRRHLNRAVWLDFAKYCELPERAARRIIAEQVEALDSALRLVSASFLSDGAKDRYAAFLRANTSALTA